MIVDTGLIVALERDDRQAWLLLRAARERGQRYGSPRSDLVLAVDGEALPVGLRPRARVAA